ncbi:hypothetical protein EVA_20840 [gut metagenome]|uniref:Uncharacterized protein n=1 Tax=gut metagenome TaxID=749906 RepID=J9F845_9ZZZZ
MRYLYNERLGEYAKVVSGLLERLYYFSSFVSTLSV